MLRCIAIRYLSTTNLLNGEGRMMYKLLKKPRKQKKFIYNDPPILSSTSSVGSITGDAKKSVNGKRINVLNKLFMGHITDLMSTGTYSNAFTGYGIEINRVKVTPDFKLIQVYWLANSNEPVDNIEEILKSHASALRHELSQLRVIGVVPKIEFFKDKQYILLKQLDDKLKEADYGEDYEPVDSVSQLRKTLALESSIEPHIRAKIEKLEESETERKANVDVSMLDIPSMPQNVLGLDHAAIMERVLRHMQKSKGFNQTSSERSKEGCILANEVNQDPVVYQSRRLQQEAFREFLRKRQLLRQKMQRAEKASTRLELEYFEDEWLQQEEDHLKQFDFDEYLADENDSFEADEENDNVMKT